MGAFEIYKVKSMKGNEPYPGGNEDNAYLQEYKRKVAMEKKKALFQAKVSKYCCLFLQYQYNTVRRWGSIPPFLPLFWESLLKVFHPPFFADFLEPIFLAKFDFLLKY